MNPPGAKIYLPAQTVAEVCDMTLVALDNRYRPEDWATPRDFVYAGRALTLLYCEASLPQLVDALLARGARDAALRLREYLGRIASHPPARGEGPEASGPLVPVQRELVERSEDEIGRELAHRAHPSDRELGWWEDPV